MSWVCSFLDGGENAMSKKIKPILICILLLVILSACTETAPSHPFRCSQRKVLCVKLEAEEPVVKGEPIHLIATVTSSQGIQDMGISLSYPVNAVIVENGLQDQSLAMKEFTTWNGGTGAVTSIMAGQSLTFKWQVLLPSGEGSYTYSYLIVAGASTPQGLYIANSLSIHQTQDDLKINYSGTTFPVTPGPLPTPDATLVYSITPYP